MSRDTRECAADDERWRGEERRGARRRLTNESDGVGRDAHQLRVVAGEAQSRDDRRQKATNAVSGVNHVDLTEHLLCESVERAPAEEAADPHEQHVRALERPDDLEPAEVVVLLVLGDRTVRDEAFFNVPLLLLGQEERMSRRAGEEEERRDPKQDGEDAFLQRTSVNQGQLVRWRDTSTNQDEDPRPAMLPADTFHMRDGCRKQARECTCNTEARSVSEEHVRSTDRVYSPAREADTKKIEMLDIKRMSVRGNDDTSGHRRTGGSASCEGKTLQGTSTSREEARLTPLSILVNMFGMTRPTFDHTKEETGSDKTVICCDSTYGPN